MSKESRKFKVPDQLANLYDFANSLDLRHFVHRGVQRVPTDDLASPPQLAAWMAARGLSRPGGMITPTMLESALALRSAVRAYLAREPAERRRDPELLDALNKVTGLFPLIVEAQSGGTTLKPARHDALAGLSAIVAELHDGAASGMLDRLKTCAAEECRRVFFDQSKPGSRRWCVSALCGNRIKTRAYRERQQRQR